MSRVTSEVDFAPPFCTSASGREYRRKPGRRGYVTDELARQIFAMQSEIRTVERRMDKLLEEAGVPYQNRPRILRQIRLTRGLPAAERFRLGLKFSSKGVRRDSQVVKTEDIT